MSGRARLDLVSTREIDEYLRIVEEPKRSALEALRRTIMQIVANTVASAPIALTPLSRLPLGNLSTFAKEMFEPTPCKVTLDGMRLPGDSFTGVHVASMSINLGGVLKFFGQADQPAWM